MTASTSLEREPVLPRLVTQWARLDSSYSGRVFLFWRSDPAARYEHLGSIGLGAFSGSVLMFIGSIVYRLLETLTRLSGSG
jgi:hypothetical protein